jgi:hypothetical protein
VYNSTYKKLAVQWLNEALCFVSRSVVTDNFVLRNRQLLVAANRWNQLSHNALKNKCQKKQGAIEKPISSAEN